MKSGRRKLLVASIGLATITLAGGCDDGFTSGNLVAPPPVDAGVDAGASDAGASDAGASDAGASDAGRDGGASE